MYFSCQQDNTFKIYEKEFSLKMKNDTINYFSVSVAKKLNKSFTLSVKI